MAVSYLLIRSIQPKPERMFVIPEEYIILLVVGVLMLIAGIANAYIVKRAEIKAKYNQ